MKYAYESIAEDILGRIRRGEWQKGSKIPGLGTLETMYSQSRMTIYKALRELADGGYLSMSRGRGTVVKAAYTKERMGILVGQVSLHPQKTPFAFLCLGHAQAYFTRCGMDVHVYSENSLVPAHLPSNFKEDLAKRRLVGLLSIESPATLSYTRGEAWPPHAIPHVAIDCFSSSYRVYIDDRVFVDRAVAIASQNGRTLVALGNNGVVFPADYLRESLQANNLTLWTDPSAFPAPAPHHEESWGYDLMRRIWDCEEKPGAIIVPDDVVTKGVAQAALGLGIRVPEDLLIISMTNRDAGIFYPVPVTRLEVDAEALVASAGDLLNQLRNNPDLPSETRLLPPELATTAFAPAYANVQGR